MPLFVKVGPEEVVVRDSEALLEGSSGIHLPLTVFVLDFFDFHAVSHSWAGPFRTPLSFKVFCDFVDLRKFSVWFFYRFV